MNMNKNDVPYCIGSVSFFFLFMKYKKIRIHESLLLATMAACADVTSQ